MFIATSASSGRFGPEAERAGHPSRAIQLRIGEIPKTWSNQRAVHPLGRGHNTSWYVRPPIAGLRALPANGLRGRRTLSRPE